VIGLIKLLHPPDVLGGETPHGAKMGGYMVCKLLNHRLAPAALIGFFAHLFTDLPVEVDDFCVYHFKDPFFGGLYEGKNVVKVFHRVVIMHYIVFVHNYVLSQLASPQALYYMLSLLPSIDGFYLTLSV
jgi:hypothetical protein